MTTETETNTQEVVDPNVSPVDGDLQSARVEELEAEVAELKQRLGNAVRTHGEEMKQREEEYLQWAGNFRAYYDELSNTKDSTIKELEEKLIGLSDSEGAKVVLEARDRRDEIEAAKREARQAQEDARKASINEAKETALKTFPDLTAEDLQDVQSADDVWRRVGENTQKKVESVQQSMEERFAELRAEMQAQISGNDTQEIQQQEDASRTPGSSSQPPSVPNNVRGAGNDPRFARLAALKSDYEDALKSRKLVRVAGLRADIAVLEQELRRDGLTQ